MSVDVIVYTTDNCRYCNAAKKLLDKRGVTYREEKLAADPASRELIGQLTGGFSFPQIVIAGDPVGGFDELNALHRSGELTGLLTR